MQNSVFEFLEVQIKISNAEKIVEHNNILMIYRSNAKTSKYRLVLYFIYNQYQQFFL